MIAKPTLSTVLELYLKNRPLAVRTKRQYRQAIERCFADWLNRPVFDITTQECIERHQALSSSSETRASSGGRGMANLAFRTLSTMINYALAYYEVELLYTNPVSRFDGLAVWAELRPRDTYLNAEQLAVWFKAMQQIFPSIDRDLYVALLLTGCRFGEMAGLEWDEVDQDAGLIRLPAERTKAKRPHDFPISTQLARLLDERRHCQVSKYVFPMVESPFRPYSPGRRAYERVEKLVGFDCNPHVLRRTFATHAANTLGFDTHLITRCLNHSDKSITDRYIKRQPEAMRPVFQGIGDWFDFTVYGKKPRIRLTVGLLRSS